MSLWDYIVWPFVRLMEFLYNWTQNYGVSVILFALVVNLILLPFMAKSKKSMMRTTRFQPKMKALEKKYADNKEKYQQEVAKLYREEGINPMSGCLWSLLPFPIIIALYSVIRQPLEKMMGISSEGVKKITEWAAQNAGFISTNKTYDEIGVTDALHQHWDAAVNALGDLADKLMNLDYSFLGMNLGAVPNWKVWTIDFANTSTALPALGLFLIPLIAALLSWLSMKISQATNPTAGGAQAEASMKTMNIFMPIMSIWICFIMPAALCVYLIANSIFGIIRDVVLTKIYKRKLDIEDAERIAKEKAKEEEIRRRHEETERLRAEGATVRNNNTSKKKMQAQSKQQSDERRAANEKAERDAKRERLGIKSNEGENPSQVGNRRYARGRAYDPNRFADAAAPAAETEASEETASEDKPE